MSTDRLKILQLVSDGGIDAATASKILSGKLDVADYVQSEPAEPAERAEEDIAEEVSDVEEVPEPTAKAHISIIAVEEEEDVSDSEPSDTESDGSEKRVRILVTGKPIKLDLDITMPSGVVSAAKQFGAYVLKEESDAPWEEVNFTFNEGKQNVRIFTEQTL